MGAKQKPKVNSFKELGELASRQNMPKIHRIYAVVSDGSFKHGNRGKANESGYGGFVFKYEVHVTDETTAIPPEKIELCNIFHGACHQPQSSTQVEYGATAAGLNFIPENSNVIVMSDLEKAVFVINKKMEVDTDLERILEDKAKLYNFIAGHKVNDYHESKRYNCLLCACDGLSKQRNRESYFKQIEIHKPLFDGNGAVVYNMTGDLMLLSMKRLVEKRKQVTDDLAYRVNQEGVGLKEAISSQIKLYDPRTVSCRYQIKDTVVLPEDEPAMGFAARIQSLMQCAYYIRPEDVYAGVNEYLRHVGAPAFNPAAGTL